MLEYLPVITHSQLRDFVLSLEFHAYYHKVAITRPRYHRVAVARDNPSWAAVITYLTAVSKAHAPIASLGMTEASAA